MEHFCLRWNNFHRNMSSGFRALLLEDTLVDVTLAADGHFVQAHRLVLSVCSPYFKELFSVNPCYHPIVILKDVKYKQLTDVLSFIYQGEVSVRQEDLPDFLKTAELLQIRGLADQTSGKENSSINADKSTSTGLPVRCAPPEEGHVGGGSRDKLQSFLRGVPTLTDNASQTHEGTFPVVSTASSSANIGGVISDEGMFLQIPIKQELPDVVDEFDQEHTLVETEDHDTREIQTNEDGHNGGPHILQNMSLEGLHGPLNRTWTVPSTNDGASTSRKLVRDRKAIENNPTFHVKKRIHGRKQRLIALNKIRNFLVTPKRSRRIAFARRMRERKYVIKKSALGSDMVTDVSISLPSVSKHASNMKARINSEKELKKRPIVPEKNKSKVLLSASNALMNCNDNSHVDFDVPRRKRVVRSGNQKTTHEQSDKIITESTESSEDNEISDVPRETNSGEEISSSSVSVNKRTAMNKEKMVVMLAPKKTKTAVILARKAKSDVTLLDNTNSPEVLPVSTELSSKIIRSGKSTKQDGAERSIPGCILRSSVPNSSVKELTIGVPNGDSCRHSGCVGCRDDN